MSAFLSILLVITLSINSSLFSISCINFSIPEQIIHTTTSETEDVLLSLDPVSSNSVSADSSSTSPEALTTATDSMGLSCESALLMEASTGTVIYEKKADEQYRPASITKIMTLILIFDALSSNKISLDDIVTVSEHAASMGGSQVYLEPGETQTVDTMIKCITVASANDACVAMAEHISGSESAFVNQMNERAKGLGMNQTTFVNCCGLDVDGHITSARDIALMSRELITKYPDIFHYTKIWMENITHTTKRGTSEFGLSNTNKLIRHYSYATGLKTGYTSLAGFCISATAQKDDVELIAVIMKAASSKIRNAEAVSLLNYGFSVCQVYKDANDSAPDSLPVKKGTKDSVPLYYSSPFNYVSVDGSDMSAIEKKLELPTEINAPVVKGDIAGRAVYLLNGKEIGFVNILYTETVESATFKDYFWDLLRIYLIA